MNRDEEKSMKSLYGRLYEDLKSAGYDLADERLAYLVTMVGQRYDNRKDIRLMWIGRAINGWENKGSATDAEAFASAAMKDFQARDRFQWLLSYHYRRSAFWRTCEQVHGRLLPELEQDERWFEDIAWANLYPVAPAEQGNPSAKLCEVQRVASGKLLQDQIDALRPTHIVFVTGWDWFDEFNCAGEKPLFQEIRQNVEPNSPIVGLGSINGCTAIVTRRPEYRPERPFSEAVSNALLGK